MITPAALSAALAERKRRILDVAQVALPPGQFDAFRRIVLDELGESGLLGDLRAAGREAGGAHPRRNGAAGNP